QPVLFRHCTLPWSRAPWVAIAIPYAITARRGGGGQAPRVVSQSETMATQSPPIHRAGGAGGALGNPIGLSGPPPAGRLPGRLSRPTTTGFPRPHPPRPPSPRCSRSDRRLAIVGQF